jgi:membrane protease YdiL (CAAX protease family)
MQLSSEVERVKLEALVSPWKWSDLLLFEALACSVSLVFSVAGSVAPEITVSVPANGVSIGSNTVLLLASSLVPALVLLIWFAESRSATLRFAAGFRIYLVGLVIGFALPFVSYIGARHSYPLWGSGTGISWVRVFCINLLLSPLWEEIIWRGYFYPKVSSMLKMPEALLVSSLGWTVWHIGFLFYLYHFGVTGSILPILVVQFFFVGVIQCSVFTLGNNSLAPCVLLHTAFNASTATYYGSYDRMADLGSYVAESIMMLLVAAILFRAVARREKRLRLGAGAAP